MFYTKHCQECACYDYDKKLCIALNEHKGKSTEACYGFIPYASKENDQ